MFPVSPRLLRRGLNLPLGQGFGCPMTNTATRFWLLREARRLGAGLL